MFALVDCNSFFCSCEKVFHPGLRGRPVCVMSGNDGIIVALTQEAKAVGLHRGDAVFKVQDILRKNDVAVFSTNMYLYAAMSKRIASILRGACDRVEQYSIDECFIDLQGYEKHYDIEEYMRETAYRVRLWTDVPVSVGIAATKTLAKIGSRFAKNYRGYRSVCVIDTDAKRRKALSISAMDDVWGLGRRTCAKLIAAGINTPLEFADRPLSWVRSHFTKPAVQTWHELNGYPCISTEEVLQRQTICTSRSFGDMVESLDDLKASVATFAGSCANKLRGQGGVARCVTVFITSNPFREDLPQYGGELSERLPVASADTIEITQTAIGILRKIYRPGIRYKRSGVVLSDISPSDIVQQDLFDPVRNRPERDVLSRTIDGMNGRFGLKTVRLAVEDAGTSSWHSRSCHRSRAYLTDIRDILTIGD